MTPEDEATQEEQMRRWLITQGYQQPYGTNDAEIRRNLRIQGKCADFIGFHPQRGTWLIGESKSGDIEAAYLQLANTLQVLASREPTAAGNTELLIYISAQQYERLIQHGLSGYFVRDGFWETRTRSTFFSLFC